MAKTEEYLSQSKYAEHRNVTKGYIGRLGKEGRLHLIKGKLNVEMSDAELDNKSNDDKAPNYWIEKALHEKAKRELAELDLKLKQDQLVEVDQVGDHLDKIFSAVRQRLLATPSKIAPLVHAEESVGGARIVLESAVFEVLSELSQFIPVEPKTAKYLRRHLAEMALDLGQSETWIQQALGHCSDSEQTKKYMRVRGETMVGVFEKIANHG